MDTQFYTAPVTTRNFTDLQKLVLQQIAHHAVVPKGDSARLLQVLTADKPDFHGFLLHHADVDAPLAYVLYQDFITEEGPGIYLQDICVSETYRHGGDRPAEHAHITSVGKHAYTALLRNSAESGHEFVMWSVAGDNEGALRFYDRMGADLLARTIYDMTNLKSAPPQAADGITVAPLGADEIAALPRHIAPRAAAAQQSHHADVIAARIKEQVSALAFANRLYSTFRNEYDMEVAPAIFLTAQDNEAQLAQLLRGLTQVMTDKGLTGYLFCTAPGDEAAPHKSVYKALGGKLDSFTGEPAGTTRLFRTTPRK